MNTSVALLTGGTDKPYALGLAAALAARRVRVEFIGSNELDCPQVRAIPGLIFLNLRGDQREQVPFADKLVRVVVYYGRLLRYVAAAKPRILHILWNSRFELFDRTVLMACYRLLRKRVVLTAHNVNSAARDGRDGWVNRLSLRIQYRLCDHVFVHTDAMKRQLVSAFGMLDHRVTVIPFGINDTIPRSEVTPTDARHRLGIRVGELALLFFGQIAPYKGLEYLIAAVAMLAKAGEQVHLIIGGKVKRGSEDYWRNIERLIVDYGIGDLVIRNIRFIPDDEVENYFKAADAVVIPYLDIFQSGVPFLAFSFGLPVIATDVGSLHEDVTNETGFLCRPKDPADLARAIAEFYESELHQHRDRARVRIRTFASERHSWAVVAERTRAVYANLTRDRRGPNPVCSRAGQKPSKCQE
jgi:D-inositol-3-phosphate glycosyltransferase